MAKVIMVQGTMSNSGKSFVTAGLCRVFKQDGYKVAPFKSQNMANNSYITKDGKEMGRAQAMQAEACDIEPSVYMNPILLKPNSDMGSQVIILGKVYGNMKAREYFAKKKSYVEYIMHSYEELSKEYDIIVVEGAGSPAEINLMEDDIVNMGLAKMLNAPVLLVGDIDRGGVFASLYGTVKLLEPEDQKRVKGLIINKFRGDIDILKPGIGMIEEKLGIGVLGTIPMKYIDIDDEDSLSSRLDENKNKAIKAIDIAVIRFEHISNFTDFNALSRIDSVSLRYVKRADELKEPDIIILPGSKSTISDLFKLRESGLESRIMKLVEKGSMLIGICGGFQMLGKYIVDEEGVEYKGRVEGMGLLDAYTKFSTDKSLNNGVYKLNTKVELCKGLSNTSVEGYEIHMGQTYSLGDDEQLLLEEGMEADSQRVLGLINDKCFGTYLHGIFDNEEFTRNLLNTVAEKKGVELKEDFVSTEDYKKREYDKLADLVRNSLDMEKLYKILDLKD